jgi:hypothetical protein
MLGGGAGHWSLQKSANPRGLGVETAGMRAGKKITGTRTPPGQSGRGQGRRSACQCREAPVRACVNPEQRLVQALLPQAAREAAEHAIDTPDRAPSPPR